MTLHITKKTSVAQIKEQFAAKFPFLKLEFLVNKPGKNLQSKVEMANSRKLLGELQPRMPEGSIAISEELTVSALEKKFRSDFLLNAQVFRRSGSLWLETTITDSWSLARQNEHGREITESYNRQDVPDYNYERDTDAVE